jgi:hypothetical protein
MSLDYFRLCLVCCSAVMRHSVTFWTSNFEQIKVKGKGKDHPRTGHEGPEGEQTYTSTLPLTSALDGVGGQRHAPAALPPGKDPVPIVEEAGWAPGPVWTGAENIAPPQGFDPRTVQSVASRYTDWVIPAPNETGGER